MRKHLLSMIGLIIALSLVLVACQAPAAPPTEAPAAPTEAPAAQTGGGGTIKIATQSPLSGGQSILGVDIKNGAQLGLDQLGGPLRDMGFTLELAPFDDQASPDVGVANAKNIVSDPAILCGVGHLNSGVMIPASEEYHTAGLAFVSPANTNPVVTTRGYLEVTRIVGRDDVQAPVAEEFALTELQAASAYIIHDKTAYGQGVAGFFRTSAEIDNMQVLAFEGTEETANFDPIITPILAANPDVLFFAGIYNQAGVFFKQARAAGYTGTFLGTDGMDSSELATLAGDALTTDGGMYYTAVAGPASAYPKAAQFAADFEAEFGAAPQPFSAQAYDSAGICLAGIQDAADAAGGAMPTRAAVANAIRAVKYEGITGSLEFDSIGDLPVANYFIIKVNATSADTWGDNEIVSTISLPSPGA